ncbi:hypothetical protein DealDRAFT_2513 [Dethiobacter alkaliphilus AHT 1]|uniref:Alkyl hydroperoxide reductase subunit C/ Thiol specific antioxidant domain-containing protein n=2 Tax=Dethiobacter TaxID=427925 RepID=C0GJ54_DETAL|nr:hypothetical protein DealDRAFT_2513 [Dethiobacter alkaliphilus AHT 1]
MSIEKKPAVGQKAPDFSLSAATQEEVALSSLQGKAVLLAFVSSSG